mgnify:CR=1 FL=1
MYSYSSKYELFLPVIWRMLDWGVTWEIVPYVELIVSNLGLEWSLQLISN